MVQEEALSGVGGAATRGQAEAGLEPYVHAKGDADLGRALIVQRYVSNILALKSSGLISVSAARHGVRSDCSGGIVFRRYGDFTTGAGHFGAPWRPYLIPVIPFRPKLIEARLQTPRILDTIQQLGSIVGLNSL